MKAPNVITGTIEPLRKYVDPKPIITPNQSTRYPTSDGRLIPDLDASMVKAFIEDAKKEGFGINAIVARAFNPAMAKDCQHWGIIRGFYNHVPTYGGYAPLEVRWIFENWTTKMWPDDLFIIHSHVDDEVLNDILEEQIDHGSE